MSAVVGGGQGALYGMGSVVYEFQSAFMWDGPFAPRYTNAQFSSAMVDASNSPTTTCRMGLVLGKIAATNLWTNYSPTATDGSDVAQGILTIGLRMTDVYANAVQRFWGVCVGGCLKASQLNGLDGMARQQLSDAFQFDDDLPGRCWYPYRRVQTKTANYTVTAADNGSVFSNVGAIGEVDLTLPTIANGLVYTLKCDAAQVFKFISAEGANMIGDTLTRSNTSVTAIGGGLMVYSNPGATKWYIENKSSGSQTVSYA